MAYSSDYKHFPRIPDDIRAETLLECFHTGSFKISVCGLHKRNAYNDILGRDIYKENKDDGKPVIDLARRSLYHTLPEYMFHAPDRFTNLMGDKKKEEFRRECELQELEKSRALRFFAPIDLRLFLLSADSREKTQPYTEENIVLIKILADELTDEQRNNPYISKTMPFLPFCKDIRGDKTLLTVLLRKVLTDENISIDTAQQPAVHHDSSPRYDDSLGTDLGEGFLGNIYDESVITYTLRYWDSEQCNDGFHDFLRQMEQFRMFIQHYFLSVEQVLTFDISTDDDTLTLAGESGGDGCYNFLDYNTNI